MPVRRNSHAFQEKMKFRFQNEFVSHPSHCGILVKDGLLDVVVKTKQKNYKQTADDTKI